MALVSLVMVIMSIATMALVSLVMVIMSIASMALVSLVMVIMSIASVALVSLMVAFVSLVLIMSITKAFINTINTVKEVITCEVFEEAVRMANNTYQEKKSGKPHFYDVLSPFHRVTPH